MSLFNSSTDFVVRGALDGLAARQRVYANNLANVETPGFRPSDVSFESELRRARDEMQNPDADPQATPELTPSVTPSTQETGRVDGNEVQLDQQVMLMAENELNYQALTAAARLREGLLRTAVTDGRQ